MSFDARVYFSAVPADLTQQWEAALRELGRKETVLVPVDWESKGHWYILEKPTDNPDDSFSIEVGPIDDEEIEREASADDERSLLAKAHCVAFVSTRLSEGSAALMAAGSLAKATGGVMLEYQGAAFESAFEADLAAHRGLRGPEGQPTLVERGFYDARLAWELAKAVSKFEQRGNTQRSAPRPASAAPHKNVLSTVVIGVVLLFVVLYKLHKAGYF